MKPKLPSPAMSVALLALFVALGGSSYAAVKINGKSIKKGTIRGTALKKNTLTGAQINESKLGKVPSANSADTAGSASSANTALEAANAAKLGGLTREAFMTGPNSVSTSARVLPLGSLQTLHELPGLAQITAVCSANSTRFGVKALSDGVIWAGSKVAGSTAESKGGVLDQGESDDLQYAANQTGRLMIWRNAAPGSVAAVDFGSSLCRTALILSAPE